MSDHRKATACEQKSILYGCRWPYCSCPREGQHPQGFAPAEPVGGADFLEAAHKWQERAEKAERELGEALTDREQLNNDVDGLHRIIKEDREARENAEREVAETRTVTCDKCAFRYGAEHTLADGSYICPMCEVAGLRADAERYRWLRDRWGTQQGSATIEWRLPLIDTFGEVEAFDKAIDSALKETKND